MTFKKVKLIEKAPLSLSDRVELLLIYANQKPATSLAIQGKYYFSQTDTYEIALKDVNQMRKLLRYLKLPFIQDKPRRFCSEYIEHDDGRIEYTYRRLLEFYISRDIEKAESLKKAFEMMDESEMGRLFGFTETAIQGYLGFREPFMGQTRDGKPLGFFTQFVFSQAFKDEEIKAISKRWHDTVKKLSPRLYEEIQEYEAKDEINKSHLLWRDANGMFVYYPDYDEEVEIVKLPQYFR